MLAETEEVGGPEEKMDRLGVLKKVECWVAPVGVTRSSSGMDTVDVCSRLDTRLGNGVAAVELPPVDEGTGGKVHDGARAGL